MKQGKERVRLKDKRRRTSYVFVSAVALLACAVLGGVAYLTRLPQVTVASVVVEGAVHVSGEEVRQTTEDILDGTYGLLLPKRMTYLVPRGAVAAAIVSQYPAVKSVSVKERAPQELVVQVEERVPYVLWCGDTCYRMDEYGYIFAQAEAGDTLRRYSGGTYAIGGTYLEGGFHDFDRLVRALEGVAPQPITAVHVEGSDAFLRLEGGGEVRFLYGSDHRELERRLEAVFTSDAFDTEKKLDYVELRFGNKATVKFSD